MADESNPPPATPPTASAPMTPEAERIRRRRSMAIALALGALVVIFYAVSMVKTIR